MTKAEKIEDFKNSIYSEYGQEVSYKHFNEICKKTYEFLSNFNLSNKKFNSLLDEIVKDIFKVN